MPKDKQPLKEYKIDDEEKRVYQISVFGVGVVHEIHVDHPKILFMGEGHAFHRVYNGETVVCAPAPGVLRDHEGRPIGFVTLIWVPREGEDICRF